MPYYVTKRIKGRPYLYLQWSWREGGKVKTDGVYVAPIDPSTGVVDLPEGKTPKDIYAETRETFLNGLNVSPPDSGTSSLSRQIKKRPPPETLPPIPDKFKPSAVETKPVSKPHAQPKRQTFQRDDKALTLHTAIHFNELKVSAHSIEQRHLRHEKTLAGAGLNPDTAPAITMRYGLRHRVRLFQRQNVIAIRAPRRGKGAANGLRQSFARALALSKLRALEMQKPDTFQALTLHAQTLQSQTRVELRKYLMNTNGRRRLAKALAVKLFGRIDQLRLGRTKRMPASQLGLSAWGNRSDWFEDTVLLIMEIEQHKDGYRGVVNATKTELRVAKATLTKAGKQGFSLTKLVKGERMSWGYRKRRDIRRAEARVALQQIRLERLNGLQEVFRL